MTDLPDLDHFDHNDAWNLGSGLVGVCRQNEMPVTISIHLGDQLVFHAGMPGSSANNDRWTERKSRIVRHFGRSSMEVQEHYVEDDDALAFLATFALPAEQYFPAGGAVPIRVRGALVGVLAVSGLESDEDHDLAVSALLNLAERG